jgi:hypothetical protein
MAGAWLLRGLWLKLLTSCAEEAGDPMSHVKRDGAFLRQGWAMLPCRQLTWCLIAARPERD